MSRNWVTVPSCTTWMKPGRSTTKSRGSPGGEVAKTGSSKLGPIDCRPTAEARAGASAISVRERTSSAKRALAPMRSESCPTGRRPNRRVDGLVAVVVRLVRPLDRDADVGGLVGAQLGQLDAEGVQVQTRDLLVQVLGQHMDLPAVGVGLAEQLDLGDHLVRERVRHHE